MARNAPRGPAREKNVHCRAGFLYYNGQMCANPRICVNELRISRTKPPLSARIRDRARPAQRGAGGSRAQTPIRRERNRETRAPRTARTPAQMCIRDSLQFPRPKVLTLFLMLK